MKDNKVWCCKAKDDNTINLFTEKLGITKQLSQILINRGIVSVEEAYHFLNPELTQLKDPFLLPNMNQAVERILKAINNDEHILIYGDYDVDGITSTALLTKFLRKQGALVDYYIPERLEEGYGLNQDALLWAKNSLNCDLVITVDCGVSAIDEVMTAKSNGLDIIITDHHELGPVLPSAVAIINPKLADKSCFQDLAGVGVAFKLAQALALKLDLPNSYIEEFLDLTALGTIADVVPLLNENRILVKHGLAILNRLRRPGIEALVEVAGLRNKKITTGHVAFGLAPRLNAVGRLGDASPAVELLLTDSKQTATELATKLARENTERQMVELETYKEVCERIEKEIDFSKDKVIVLASELWHPGVIGIVASKVMEKYYRPTFLLAIEGEYAKGSGRSIQGFDLFKALQHCEDVLEKYGGHFYAAGLTIKTQEIDNFRTLLNNYAKKHLSPTLLMPSQDVDLKIELSHINTDFMDELKKLEPFGAGNPEPIFYARNVRLENCRVVGKTSNHLKCRVSSHNTSLEAIGFNLGNRLEQKSKLSGYVNILFSLQENLWNGTNYLQLNLKDINLIPPFKELFNININLSKFWENSIKNTIAIKVPLRRIGAGLSFLLKDLLAFKGSELLRVDGQLNFKLNSLTQPKVILLTEPFYKKYQTTLQGNVGEALDYQQLLNQVDTYEEVTDLRGVNKEETINELIVQDKKIFIVCNYRENAEIVAKEILAKNSILDDNSVKIVFNREELYSFFLERQDVKVVISNQLLEMYNWYNYDVKIIYDAPFSKEELLLRTLRLNDKLVLLLWNKEDLTYNRDLLQAMFPRKDFLNLLAETIKKCKKEVPLTLDKLNQKLNIPAKNLNIFIMTGLKVCEELGIVTKQEGKLFPAKVDNNINWEESACYLEGLKEKEAFQQFTNSPFPLKEKTEVI